MIENRRILVVDDDDRVRRLVQAGLVKEKGWEVSTASDGEEAMRKISAHAFDLVITDLRMPGMQGLELIRLIKDASPSTQAILLTAYGSEEVQEEAEALAIHSYLTKPVPIPEIRRIAREALEKTARVREQTKPHLPERDEVEERLETLNTQANAQCVLLASGAGHLIAQAGVTKNLDAQAMAALVAANVAAMAEVAHLLGSTAVFKSFFQGGEDFSIYLRLVGEDAILIVVTSPEVKTGLVWLYTHRIADELETMLEGVIQPSLTDLDLDAFGAGVEEALNEVHLGAGGSEEQEPQPEPGSRPEPTPESTPEPSARRGGDGSSLLSLEEAVEQGLIGDDLASPGEDGIGRMLSS